MSDIKLNESIKALKIVLSKYLPDNDDALKEVNKYFRYSEIKKNTVVHNHGNIFNYILFIRKGLIRSYYLTDEGKDICYYFFKENDIVCDFQSFIQDTPSEYFFESLEDCEVITLKKKYIQLLYDTVPQMQILGRKLAEYAFLKVENRLRMFMTQDLRSKYENIKKTEAEILARVPQYHIASYLGVTPEALSRFRSKKHNY